MYWNCSNSWLWDDYSRVWLTFYVQVEVHWGEPEWMSADKVGSMLPGRPEKPGSWDTVLFHPSFGTRKRRSQRWKKEMSSAWWTHQIEGNGKISPFMCLNSKNMAEVTIQCFFFIISQLSFGKKTTNAHFNYVCFNFWLNFKCSPSPPSMACFPGSEIPLPQLKYFPGTRYLCLNLLQVKKS